VTVRLALCGDLTVTRDGGQLKISQMDFA